jgi:hypothetical protein
MSSKSQRQKPKRQTKPIKPVQHAEPASTRPEELGLDKRDELRVELAAREQRGRPPSI